MEKLYSKGIVEMLDKVAKALTSDEKVVVEIEKNKEGRIFIKTISTAIINL